MPKGNKSLKSTPSPLKNGNKRQNTSSAEVEKDLRTQKRKKLKQDNDPQSNVTQQDTANSDVDSQSSESEDEVPDQAAENNYSEESDSDESDEVEVAKPDSVDTTNDVEVSEEEDEEIDEEEEEDEKTSEDENEDETSTVKEPELGTIDNMDNTAEVDKESEVRKVIIKNIPIQITSTALEQLFSKYGEVEKTVLAPKTKHSLCGYIVFKNREDAEKSLELNGMEIHGHHLLVKLLSDRNVLATHSIIMKCENYVSIDVLWNALESFGIIKSIRSTLNQHHTIITFESADSVEIALKTGKVTIENEEHCIFKTTEKELEFINNPKPVSEKSVKKGKNVKKSNSNKSFEHSPQTRNYNRGSEGSFRGRGGSYRGKGDDERTGSYRGRGSFDRGRGGRGGFDRGRGGRGGVDRGRGGRGGFDRGRGGFDRGRGGRGGFDRGRGGGSDRGRGGYNRGRGGFDRGRGWSRGGRGGYNSQPPIEIGPPTPKLEDVLSPGLLVHKEKFGKNSFTISFPGQEKNS